MHFFLQMTVADVAVSMLQLLLLLTAVTQAAVALRDSMLTTDLLQRFLWLWTVASTNARTHISHQEDLSSSRYHAQSRTSPAALSVTVCHRRTICRRWTSYWESYGKEQDGRRTVPTNHRWHCRHISFTAQLPFVCVERSGGQLKRDTGKSGGDSEIEHIVEPLRKVSYGGNWQHQWTSNITGCSYMFHIVAGGQNCHLGGLDHKPLCISSTECYDHQKDNNSWQTELVHLVPI